MRSAQIESEEDKKWLRETHLKHYLGNRIYHHMLFDFEVAELEGNEDSPTKVMLFKKNHYRCIPWVFEVNGAGELVYERNKSRGAGTLRPKNARERKAGCL
jgi:hypothetical protein